MQKSNSILSLQEIQMYVQQQCEKRGWTERTDAERMMLLAEEVGEVAKELRKHTGKFGYRTPDTTDDLGDELIDVLNWIVDIANAHKVNLSDAFRRKWAATDRRIWEADEKEAESSKK